MMPFKVTLIESSGTATAVPEWVRKVLADENFKFLVQPCESRADLENYAFDSDVVWLWGSRVLTPDSLEVLSRCGAILRSGSGTDNVPVAEATTRNIMVVNTPAAVAQEVSDHTIALLLAVVRHIAAQDRLLRSGTWDFRRDNQRWHLAGSTLGLIGFGHIARLVAQKMTAFDVRVLVHDPEVRPEQIRSRGAEPVNLTDLLSQSDFISVHCPLTSSTRHLVGTKEIGLMKANAILINTSRGPIVDEVSLAEALEAKRIGGAGLDVFEEEPLPVGSPLLQLENVVLTPHIAGYSDLYPDSFWRYSVESLVAIAYGYWPRSVVNDVNPRWPLRRRQWPSRPQIDPLAQSEILIAGSCSAPHEARET